MLPIKKPVVSYLAMDKNKVLNMLGLAMRAGKLVTGEELTLKEIRRNKARLVLIATDAGKNTHKNISDKCTYYKIPYNNRLTALEIGGAIGKPRMVIGILDAGFAKKIGELIQG